MSLRSHLGLFCSIFILFLNVRLTPGREAWLVIDHFKGASPLQRLQALPRPHYWRRNITSLDISGLPQYWRRNTSHFTCCSQRGPSCCPVNTCWLFWGLSSLQVCWIPCSQPLLSPVQALAADRFCLWCWCFVRVYLCFGVPGNLCHLMLPHMLSMDWILGMFV